MAAVTVILPNSTFLHIPRTGGTWVRKALFANHLVEQELRSTSREQSSENALNSWHMIPDEFSNAFCFVRHPATWYQSYWSHKQGTRSWSDMNPFDAQCQHDDFLRFVSRALVAYPDGYVTWLYEFYTDHADFVGLQEHLADDLVAALRWAGEDYTLDAISSVAKENVAQDEWKNRAKYDEDTLRKVLRVEKKIIEEYGYDRYLPPVLFH